MVHPHDRLIRYILGRREYAVAFARLVLPPAVTAALDLDGLRPAPGRQLDPELRERIVDLLFHLPLRGGGSARTLAGVGRPGGRGGGGRGVGAGRRTRRGFHSGDRAR